MTVIHGLIIIAFGFIALSLACAVGFALRREPKVGWRFNAPADPFARPFGEMPWFSQAELDVLARRAMRRAARDPLRRALDGVDPEPGRVALRPVPGGGGFLDPLGRRRLELIQGGRP